MKIPKVDEGKVVVICADSATGIVLNNDGTYYVGVGEDYYIIFNNYAMARSYAYSVISTNSTDKGREVLIYDNQGQYLESIR